MYMYIVCAYIMTILCSHASTLSVHIICSHLHCLLQEQCSTDTCMWQVFSTDPTSDCNSLRRNSMYNVIDTVHIQMYIHLYYFVV